MQGEDEDDRFRLPFPTDAETGHLLELVGRSKRSRPSVDLEKEMTARYFRGDYTGALRAAELVLGRDTNNVSARKCAEECRAHLEQAYVARLGSLDRIPVVAVTEREARLRGLDPRAALLLGEIDGRRTIRELVSSSSVTRIEALRTLVELLDSGAARFDPP